jgi:hypothetical protein
VAVKVDQAQSATRPGALLALLAGALAVAALVMHGLLNRSARRPARRAPRTPIWDTPDPWARSRRDQPGSATSALARSKAPPLAPSSNGPEPDPVGPIEKKLQQLLDGWSSRAA